MVALRLGLVFDPKPDERATDVENEWDARTLTDTYLYDASGGTDLESMEEPFHLFWRKLIARHTGHVPESLDLDADFSALGIDDAALKRIHRDIEEGVYGGLSVPWDELKTPRQVAELMLVMPRKVTVSNPPKDAMGRTQG